MNVRLYINIPLINNQEVTLPFDQSHYCATVLRLKPQSEVILFNGLDGTYRALIRDNSKKKVVLKIIERVKIFQALPSLTLVFSPIKQDRLNFMIEKATELGVTHFQPVITQYTQVHKFNQERLLKIAIEASEQSERQCIPAFSEICKLQDYMKNHPESAKIAFGYERYHEESSHGLDEKINFNGLLIGPEGGFSPEEVKLLKGHFQPISLGQTILRTETAAVVGLDRIRRL